MEDVEPSDFNKDLYKSQIAKDENKLKNHRINQKLMDALAAARKEKGLDDENLESDFDPEIFVDQQFKDFSINDLRDHQQAILNMFYQFNNA